MRRILPTLACFAGLTVTSLAFAGFVKLGAADVTASTTKAEDERGKYYETNLLDNMSSTMWVEGDAEGSGLGSTLKFTFAAPTKVETIKLWNGNWYSYEYWQAYNRVKDLEIRFPDGSSQKVTLKDERVAEEISIDSPKAVEWIELRVKSIHGGEVYNDTAISEVVFVDDSAAEEVKVKSYKASSIYPEDADGSYGPEKMEDTLRDTMWCENDKAGDGTGEWLEFDFGSPQTVSKLRLVNGNGYNMSFCFKSNRATKAKLSFSDGSSQDVDMNFMCSAQTISFAETTTSSVKVTFTEVKKGSEFNDLCVSEAAFLP